MPVDYTVPALARAVHVLDLLTEKPEGISLADLAKLVGVPKSTLFRIMVTLQAEGLVHHDDLRKIYTLGMRLAQWGHAVLEWTDVRHVAHDRLVALAKKTSESFYVSMLEGTEVVLVDRADTPDVWKMIYRLGVRPPAHATAAGLVLLAGADARTIGSVIKRHGLEQFTARTTTSPDALAIRLETIRRSGYAISDGEHRPDLCSVAVPIFGVQRQTIAALSISMHADRSDKEEHIHHLLPMLREEARIISSNMGYREYA